MQKSTSTSVLGGLFTSTTSHPAGSTHRTGGVALGTRASSLFLALALIFMAGIGPASSAEARTADYGHEARGEAQSEAQSEAQGTAHAQEADYEASAHEVSARGQAASAYAAIFTIGGEDAFADLCEKRGARIELTWLSGAPPAVGGSKAAIFARLPAIGGEDASFMRLPLEIDLGRGRGTFQLTGRDVRIKTDRGGARGIQVERRGEEGASVGNACALRGAEVLVVTARPSAIRRASTDSRSTDSRSGSRRDGSFVWEDASLEEIERAAGGDLQFLGTDREAQEAGARVAGQPTRREQNQYARERARRRRARNLSRVGRGIDAARQVQYMRGDYRSGRRIGEASYLLQTLFGQRRGW